MSAPAPPEPVDPELLGRLLGLVDLLTPHAIRVAVTLGLPRLVGDGGSTVDELAEATGAHPGALASLLHHLAARDLLRVVEPGRFAPTGLGRLLAHPDALAALDLRGAQARMDLAWSALEHTVRTGAAGYPLAHGRPFWDHLGSDPALAASFDDYMSRNTGWTTAAAAAPVWPAEGTVADIGGGTGLLLADLLDAHPGLRGILVEMAATAERARDRLTERGVADRVTIHPGSFFDPLPAGADVYVLGHILHDWPDAEAARILRRVADATADVGTARVLLVEQVPDPHAPGPIHVHGDLLMRLLFGSHERTRDQWADLARGAGLRLSAVHALDDIRSIVELRPA